MPPDCLECRKRRRAALRRERDRKWEKQRRAWMKDGRRCDLTASQSLRLRREADRCPLCYGWLTDEPGWRNSKHLDHIVPLSLGGEHTLANVRILCAQCNLRRGKGRFRAAA